MNRTTKLLHRFSKGDRCMEIGPGYNPLLPKRNGWNTLTVDHTDRAGLVEKYRRFDVDTSLIEEVDVVWAGGALDEAIPAALLGTVDACVASHVIEHIPNPVMFFRSMARILKPGGLLSLAVPDKRYCFDFFQPSTCSGDWLHAWKRNARIHSQRAMFQHIAATISADGATTWGQGAILRDFRCLTDSSLFAAFKRFESYAEDGDDTPYQDCHAWHFTPASFSLLMLELSQLGLVPFTIEETHPACGCEFFVLLSNSPPEKLNDDVLQTRRLALMRTAIEEQAEQARLLRHSPLRFGLNAVVRGIVRRLKAILQPMRRP